MNKFWDDRAKHYDKLFWTYDTEYLDKIINIVKLDKDDLVLDVGTGTGVIAKKLEPLVKQVIGIDISKSMLDKTDNISTIKWNVCDALFSNGIFDKIYARMVFHHVLNDIDTAISRCYDMLKEGGRFILAEGIPPKEDSKIEKWYSDMFRYKEDRRTLSRTELYSLFWNAGFDNIITQEYILKGFNINNWLSNSGLDKDIQDKILDIHINAPGYIKDVYNMSIVNGIVTCDTKNVIIVGEK